MSSVNEQDFIHEMEAHPGDKHVALVFADWLEEHGGKPAHAFIIRAHHSPTLGTESVFKGDQQREYPGGHVQVIKPEQDHIRTVTFAGESPPTGLKKIHAVARFHSMGGRTNGVLLRFKTDTPNKYITFYTRGVGNTRHLVNAVKEERGG